MEHTNWLPVQKQYTGRKYVQQNGHYAEQRFSL